MVTLNNIFQCKGLSKKVQNSSKLNMNKITKKKLTLFARWIKERLEKLSCWPSDYGRGNVLLIQFICFSVSL